MPCQHYLYIFENDIEFFYQLCLKRSSLIFRLDTSGCNVVSVWSFVTLQEEWSLLLYSNYYAWATKKILVANALAWMFFKTIQENNDTKKATTVLQRELNAKPTNTQPFVSNNKRAAFTKRVKSQ